MNTTANFARIYSWNPLRMNQFAYQGETGSSVPASAPSSSGAPSGGTPAPSGGPPAEVGSGGSSGTPPGAGDVLEDPFAGFDGDLDEIDLGDGTGTDPGPEPDAPAVVPAAPVVPPAAPAAPPVVPAPAPAASVTSASAPPQSAREQLSSALDGFKNNQKELNEWATRELFSLSQEETDALETDAVTMIPKLMARTYQQALMASMNMMKQFVPMMISEGVVEQGAKTAKGNEAKAEFYAAFPNLNEKDHGEAFNQWAKMYRQMNPKASRADAIKFVGNALLTQFNLHGAPAPGAVPGVVARPVPFQPARPGGRPVAQVPVDDPYSGLDQDFMDS